MGGAYVMGIFFIVAFGMLLVLEGLDIPRRARNRRNIERHRNARLLMHDRYVHEHMDGSTTLEPVIRFDDEVDVRRTPAA